MSIKWSAGILGKIGDSYKMSEEILLKQVYSSLVGIDEEATINAVDKCIKGKICPAKIVKKLALAFAEVGNKLESREYNFAQVLLAVKMMERATIYTSKSCIRCPKNKLK
jgi:methanogenic corrinoid protein MtbC1